MRSKKCVFSIKFYSCRVDIEGMRKLALIMMFSVASVVVSAEEYTIQTISALKESSITPAFEKKVQKSALSSAKKKEGACNVVTVGKYPSAKAAQHDLKKAQAIAKDVFIRPLERTTPKACESTAAEVKTKVAEKKVEQKVADAHAPAASVKKEEPAVATHEAAKTPVVNSAGVAHAVVAPSVQEVKAEPCKVQPCAKGSTAVYLYDRNLARKSDIHEAIEYYKNSPYHSFQPIAMQK